MTIDRDRLLDLLDRAHSGPIMDTFEWDSQVIPKNVKKCLKKYNLMKTCDPNNPINQDNSLANKFFQAGLEMAVETGILCTDTHRVIKYNHDEILQGLKTRPSSFNLGEGKDIVEYKSRKPEDRRLPIWTCPLSIQVTEDVFVPLLEGIASIPEVDVMEGPSLESIWNREVRGASPYELLAGKRHAALTNEALHHVGRENMGRQCLGTAPTHYGTLGSYGIPGGYKPGRDLVMAMTPAEIKTSYEVLYKLCQVYNVGGDGKLMTGSYGYIGGSPGTPEGAVVSIIANTILGFTAYQSSLQGCGAYDVRYLGNTDSEAQWAQSMLIQAISLNTNTIINTTVNALAGPATKMLLYENAVGMMNIAVSGVSNCVGVRSAGGRLLNYITPLEHKFAGEVFKASAGMSREQANKIAQELIPKYKDKLKDPPDGMSYQDCYNLKTNEPNQKWLKIYQEVKDEIRNIGIPLS